LPRTPHRRVKSAKPQARRAWAATRCAGLAARATTQSFSGKKRGHKKPARWQYAQGRKRSPAARLRPAQDAACSRKKRQQQQAAKNKASCLPRHSFLLTFFKNAAA
jgi:hypothetical protein